MYLYYFNQLSDSVLVLLRGFSLLKIIIINIAANMVCHSSTHILKLKSKTATGALQQPDSETLSTNYTGEAQSVSTSEKHWY